MKALMTLTRRSRALTVVILTITLLAAGAALFLAARPRDPLKSFDPFIEEVRANIYTSIREGFAIQDRDDPYLNDGLLKVQEMKVDAFHVGDVRRTDSLMHPVESNIRVFFSRTAEINGLRRIHVRSFAEEKGIEIFTGIADIRCGWDGTQWKLLELRQTPLLSLAWDIGSERGRMKEDTADSGEARQWFKILQARVNGDSQ